MPRLSRYPLPPEHLEELSRRIVDAALLVKNRDELSSFFNDLFTRTEKAMLGKRILIVVFLEAGYSYVEISRWLKVSQNTIASMKERLDQDGRGFRIVVERLKREEKLRQRLDAVKRMFDKLPKKTGPRWRFLKS